MKLKIESLFPLKKMFSFANTHHYKINTFFIDLLIMNKKIGIIIKKIISKLL